MIVTWLTCVGVASFVEESVIRRELSDNYCFYNPKYDSVEGAAGWAQESLKLHSTDKREYVYTRDQLEKGKTHEPLWNAAQIQLVTEGKMHGFMRKDLETLHRSDLGSPPNSELPNSRVPCSAPPFSPTWTPCCGPACRLSGLCGLTRSLSPWSPSLVSRMTSSGMYWAKKILEWTASPEEALATAIYLNDRCAITFVPLTWGLRPRRSFRCRAASCPCSGQGPWLSW